MTINGDSEASCIPTYRGVALSMGDAFIKVTPGENQTTYEVTGQFFATDSTYGFPGITGAMRKSAEEWLETVLATVGRPLTLTEVDGPLGKRLLIPSAAALDQTPARELVDPFAVKTITGVYLTGISSSDAGGRHFQVVWTFTKPLSSAGDGTTDSTIEFLGVKIGNRGGKVVTNVGESSIDITTTSYYVKADSGDADPLNYIQSLANTLHVNPSTTVPVPRGAANNRSVIKTYVSSAVGELEWVGKGSFSSAVCRSLSYQEDTPGVFTISGSFSATR